MESVPRFTRVALVLSTEYAYGRNVLRGIIAATRHRNLYPVGEKSTQKSPLAFRVYQGLYGHSNKYLARWFADWKPDGVICQVYSDRLAEEYEKLKKPVVELFMTRPESQFPRIISDDVAIGKMAAQHFLDRGFRHFGYFGAPWMNWSRDRERGFHLELQRVNGIHNATAPSPREFTFNSYGSAAGKPKSFEINKRRPAADMARWLSAMPKPLALFCANDLWGFEMMQTARELGFNVPGDVAALGVDNEELLCDIAHPPLSSIKLGAEQMGHAAVSMLDELLAGKKVSHTPVLVPPVEVVKRQSTEVLAVDDPDVAAALQHIRQHAADGLSVKQMLESVHINRRTLERRFISVLGITPLDEMRRVRLERAKELLRTDLPIYKVATKAGFATPEYLATTLLRATGMTPTQYRRQFTAR